MHEIENKIMDLGVNPNIKENPVFEDILFKVKKLGDLVKYSSDNKNVFVISKLDDKLNRKRMTNIRISIDDNDLVLIEEYVTLAKPINTDEVVIKNEKCIKCKYSKNGVMISKAMESYKEFVVNKKLQNIGLMELLYPFVSSFNSGSELSSKIIILRSGLNIGYVIKKENNELTYCGYVPLKNTKIRDLDLAGALQPCEILPMSDQKIISLLKTETNEKTRLELEKYYALKNKEYYNSNYDSNFVYVKQKRM